MRGSYSYICQYLKNRFHILPSTCYWKILKHPMHTRSWKICGTSTVLGRQACARRAGANKSLSNCSLKNPVALSRNGARQRPAALKPGFNVLYFAQLVAGRSGQLERADCTRRAVCLLIFTADVDRARRASTVRDAPSFARIMFAFFRNGRRLFSRGNGMRDIFTRVGALINIFFSRCRQSTLNTRTNGFCCFLIWDHGRLYFICDKDRIYIFFFFYLLFGKYSILRIL